MNLKTFNATNATKRGGLSKYFFRTYRGTGQCHFSPQAVRLLDVAVGDMLAFHQDQDSKKWYMEKVLTGGIDVRMQNDHELGFTTAILVRELHDSVGNTVGYGKCYIDPVPVEVGKRKLYQLDLSELKND